MSKLSLSSGSFCLAVILCSLSGTESKPGTNFVSSSVTSDGSGTRSSQVVGTIPDSSSGTYGGSSVSGNGGSAILTRLGGGSSSGEVLSRTSSGSSSSSSGESRNDGIVGIASRTGPGGTQHTIITSGGQPSIVSRTGGPQSVYVPGKGIGSIASVPGASAGTYAGPSGSAAGSFAGPVGHEYDYDA